MEEQNESVNVTPTIESYLDDIMNAETEYSTLFEKSESKEEYTYNALKKNIAMVAVNAGLIDSNEIEFLQNPVQMDDFKDLFLEDHELSYLVLGLFQLGIACGENLAKLELTEIHNN